MVRQGVAKAGLTLLIGFATVTVAGSACSSDGGTSEAPVTVASAPGPVVAVPIGPLEGKAMMDAASDDLVVIDVRTPEEFAAGHIDGAINFDLEAGQFSAQIADLPRDGSYIVYCHSGRRSALAAQAMVDAGFTGVHDLGGIQSWIDAGLPVVTG